jgi:serine/threonine protein kinase
MPARLSVIAGPDQGKLFVVPDAGLLLLGRSKLHTETPLNDPQISRVHCQIERQGKNYILTDLESTGGTCVNGRKITRHQLRDGDVIRIGSSQLAYQPEGGGAPAVEADATDDQKLEELTGKTLAHFEVGPMLAKGQSGPVFRATDQKTNQIVALKVLWPEFSQNDEEMQRFVRAMKTMMPLCHPNLVTITGAGRTGIYCWVAMEYVDGESLTQVIQRVGKDGILDWKHGLRVAVHIARALNYAHQQQIIHRNITPPNILIRKSDNLTLLGDLMLAKALEGSLAQQITKPGELLGDVAYMSPERTRGLKDIDARSDIYALGATVYAVLTGHPPLHGITLVETIMKIRQQEPSPPKQFQPSIPDAFEDAVLKMLAKKPEDRYQTAAQLIAVLERAAKLSGTPV